MAAGFKNTEGLCFRTPYGKSNEVLARIPPGKSSTGAIDYGVQLSQAKLCAIIREHALRCAGFFTIRYGTRYVSHQEDGNGLVHVETEGASAGVTTVSAPFVVACDGANSPVRKALGVPFEGFTWEDWRFVAVNIKYDFAKHGYPAANHVIDAEDWAVIVRASNVEEGLWRIATGFPPELKPDEVEPYVVEKVERLLPGPRPLDYNIEAISPYWAHEKVARTFRQGRTILCGDAAHVSILLYPSCSWAFFS